MRSIIWLVLLFGVAVIAATTLGPNDALVSIYFSAWRTDLSLNLFVVLVLLSCLVIVLAARSMHSLLSLPSRAREWRQRKSERAANAALREALAEFLAARYSRSHRAAQRVLTLQQQTAILSGDSELRALGHALAAAGLHRMRERARRDAQMRELWRSAGEDTQARSAQEGARLMAIEWAIDDRDAPRANELLAELPAGVARRTQALRLRLLAQRLTSQPLQALQTARLLAKHQAFSPAAAHSLMRTLASESLHGARDADSLRGIWQQLDADDRRDAHVAVAAARLAVSFDAAALARQILGPEWARLAELDADERNEVALATMRSANGIGSDWLPTLDNALLAWPNDPAVAAAAGAVFVECQLWGKARAPLELAARAVTLDGAARRHAWRLLARLARHADDEAGALSCESRAAQID